jgi:hypothetical protein
MTIGKKIRLFAVALKLFEPTPALRRKGRGATRKMNMDNRRLDKAEVLIRNITMIS